MSKCVEHRLFAYAAAAASLRIFAVFFSIWLPLLVAVNSYSMLAVTALRCVCVTDFNLDLFNLSLRLCTVWLSQFSAAAMDLTPSLLRKLREMVLSGDECAAHKARCNSPQYRAFAGNFALNNLLQLVQRYVSTAVHHIETLYISGECFLSRCAMRFVE